MDDLRVIADEFRDGVEGWYSQDTWCSPTARSGRGPQGQVVATNAAGSAVDVATRAMLRKFKLEDKRDYTVVEAPFPTMRAGGEEGRSHSGRAAVLARSRAAQISRPLFIQRDAIRVTDDRLGGRNRSSTEPRRNGRLHSTVRIVRWYLEEP
jgi:NitT/TauT family transport system substrate-binding protein